MVRNMCIYYLITCTCIGHIYYIRGNHSCSIRTFNCYLYKSYVCGDNVGRSCMGMYVHIIVVAFFKINDFFTKVDKAEVQEVLSNTYIFLLYALTMCVMYYLANCTWRWIILVEKCRKILPTLPCKKRNTKTNEQMVLYYYIML